MKGQAFAARLKLALNGLGLAFAGESSFRFHVLATLGVLAALVLLRP